MNVWNMNMESWWPVMGGTSPSPSPSLSLVTGGGGGLSSVYPLKSSGLAWISRQNCRSW